MSFFILFFHAPHGVRVDPEKSKGVGSSPTRSTN